MVSRLTNCLRFFLVFCALHCHAQAYQGNIGAYPMFLTMEVDENHRVWAHYFYDTQLKNISLTGVVKDMQIVLYEKYTVPEEKKELFTLERTGNELEGTWQNDNKTVKVHLEPTTLDLEHYKRKKISFIRDSVVVHGTKELVWCTEKFSKKSMFRLGNGFTKKQREFLNHNLDSIHTQYAEIALECSWADIATEVTLVSDRYISFYTYSSIFCEGAHPSHTTSGYTFDMVKGKNIEYITDIYPNTNYYTLLKNKYSEDSDIETECEFFTHESEYWEYSSWVLTTEGITITPSYPHAMTPCEVPFYLTYKELENGNHKYKK